MLTLLASRYPVSDITLLNLAPARCFTQINPLYSVTLRSVPLHSHTAISMLDTASYFLRPTSLVFSSHFFSCTTGSPYFLVVRREMRSNSSKFSVPIFSLLILRLVSHFPSHVDYVFTFHQSVFFQAPGCDPMTHNPQCSPTSATLKCPRTCIS